MWASGRLLFYFDGAAHGTSCGSQNQRYEVAVSDANGQALLSLILSAYAQQKTVDVTGTGACGSNDTEFVQLILMY
jgi:hypothetical protein